MLLLVLMLVLALMLMLVLVLMLVLLVAWVVVGMAAVCYFRASSRVWLRWWCNGLA